jgi:hypothetical protein
MHLTFNQDYTGSTPVALIPLGDKIWCLKPNWSRRLFVEQVISGFKSRQAPYHNRYQLKLIDSLDCQVNHLQRPGIVCFFF